MRKVSPFPRSEGALRRESGRAIRRLFGFLRPTTEGTRNADSSDVTTQEDSHTDCVFCWYCSENDLPPSPLFEGRPIGACCSCFSTDIAQPEEEKRERKRRRRRPMEGGDGPSTPDVGSWIWLSFTEAGRSTRREWAAYVTAHEKTRSSLSSADGPSFSVQYRNGTTESLNATPYWRYIDGDADPGVDHPEYEDSRFQQAQRNLTDPEYQRKRQSGQINWAAQWRAARAVGGCGTGSDFPVTMRGLTHRGEGTEREAFLSGRDLLDKAIN